MEKYQLPFTITNEILSYVSSIPDKPNSKNQRYIKK